MDLTDDLLAAVPAENVLVPQEAFGRVWVRAEQGDDWYCCGVALTCRWLACVVRSTEAPAHPARAPVTMTEAPALPELIEAELRAAELLALRVPRPEWLLRRPGWLEGVLATLCWAWLGETAPPLPPA